MFIRLTQLNGKPIWFNQDYIVTVEPGKGKGALVVPLGDGLDYEVLESPGSIIEALGGPLEVSSPVVSVKPPPAKATESAAASEQQQAPDFRIEGGLIVPMTPAPQVAAEPEKGQDAVPAAQAKKPAAKRNAKASAAEKQPKATAEKKAKKTVKKGTASKSTATKKKSLPAIPFSEEQLMRLQKMSPGSMRKLVNTLMSQFAVAETAPVVDALIAREVISVTDQGHIDWKWRQVTSSGEE